MHIYSGPADKVGLIFVRVHAPLRYKPGPYTWSLAMAVDDGGFIPTEEQFPVLAPSNGYQKEFRMELPAEAPNWTNRWEGQIYFRVGTPPRYGVMRARIKAIGQYLQGEYWLNPTGSANLELPPK